MRRRAFAIVSTFVILLALATILALSRYTTRAASDPSFAVYSARLARLDASVRVGLDSALGWVMEGLLAGYAPRASLHGDPASYLLARDALGLTPQELKLFGDVAVAIMVEDLNYGPELTGVASLPPCMPNDGEYGHRRAYLLRSVAVLRQGEQLTAEELVLLSFAPSGEVIGLRRVFSRLRGMRGSLP